MIRGNLLYIPLVLSLQVKVIKRAEMSMRSLLQPDQIWYGGLVRAESAMRIMSDIGSKLTHTFQVTNDGPWHVEDFNVLIEWPHRLVTSTHPQGKLKNFKGAKHTPLK